MKRNVKSVFKFLALAGATAAVTVLLFRLIRNPDITRHATLIQRENGPLPVAPEDSDDFNKVDNTKIDWHDYELVKKDSMRKGVGEQGKPAHLTVAELEGYDELYKVNGFNAALSDKIAIDRALPDIRHKGCQAKKYLKKLGTVSVIVPFHNEHWSTLLRTAHSVINRSPPHLLKEVILVDDFSSKEMMKALEKINSQ
ncbi:hypothetical protein ILUMI_11936 [Ignelater luminosus]|uniref:Glycosyltransferase 2-like domain-containing protein n=1 Tax=Ignelater luminosus TaxID=2038154 RepID=A0A8K0D0J5_IGNLU|nr:hypothetical protein ILUMI_11936 [Ignelater luminosus]